MPHDAPDQPHWHEPKAGESAGLGKFKRKPMPYDSFMEAEGVPVYRGIGVRRVQDLPLEPWKRLGGRGSYIQLYGTEGLWGCYVVEVPAGGALNEERHLYEKNVLVLEGRGSTSVTEATKSVLIVPETKALDDLLADLQRDRTTLAVVADEYGTPVGIVTVEDIVEEVVGEIADETDPAVAGMRRLANGDWWVRGHVPITDLADYGLDLPVDSEAYNSVGGFVFGELGRLPKRGDMVQADGYSLRVESVRENRVEAVRIRNEAAPQGAAESEESVREGG